MRASLPLLLVTVVAVAAAPATAQERPRPLTLEEALRSARERNRDLKAAREHLTQVAADIDRAWAPLLPTVSVQGKYTRNSQQSFFDVSSQAKAATLQANVFTDVYGLNGGTKAYVDSVCAGQPLPACLASQFGASSGATDSTDDVVFFQRYNQLDFVASAGVPLFVPWAYHQLRAARQAVAAQEQNADATEAQILTQVAAAFYAAAGNDELVVARQHAIEVTRKTLDDARARLEAGVVNRVEVTRAQQAIVRAEQALREAEDSAASAYRSLRTIAQLDGPFLVLPPEEPPAVADSTAHLTDGALRLRPEVLALGGQVAAAETTTLSNKLKWAPSLSAFGLFRANNAKGFSPDFYTWAVGLQLDWLIYDGGLHQASERQFSSVARETRLRLGQLRDQVADEVVNLHRGLATKRRAVESARTEVHLSKETLELVRAQHDAGTATQLDLLNAQDALVNAEVNLARARFDLGLSDLQLRRAAGLFPGSPTSR